MPRHFEIYRTVKSLDRDIEQVGEGTEFSSGRIAFEGEHIGSGFYSSVRELKATHPYWYVKFPDGTMI